MVISTAITTYRGYSTPPTSGTCDRINAILGGKNLAWSDTGSQERMVKSCCAVGCTNRSTKGNTLSFYHFPADTERRRLWISAINRKGWEPNEYSYVCSAHFVSGKKSNDVLSPDYVPSIFHHVSSPLKRRKEADLHAYHRRKQANRARLETALQQEEEQARGNAGRKKASIEQEAREDTEQGTMAMKSSGSSSLSVATQTDLSAEEVGYMEKRHVRLELFKKMS